MSRKHYIVCVLAMLIMALVPVSCSWTEEVGNGEYTNTPQGNFMALWSIMDEHYCFFDLKQETLGVDWNEVKVRYGASISDSVLKCCSASISVGAMNAA